LDAVGILGGNLGHMLICQGRAQSNNSGAIRRRYFKLLDISEKIPILLLNIVRLDGGSSTVSTLMAPQHDNI
jgi:hypothetical protein